MKGKALLTGDHFMLGDHAVVEGAIAAGCRFFAGYPITPASEVAERMSWRMHEAGGEYIQMEDELASMAAITGASCTGVKSMTATSGPGFSLMMENIGLAFMMEVPCVILDVMRGGPSTGMPTLTSQGDMMQVKWGSHGDYEVIAYCPSSVQEMFDFTIKAFNASEQYRLPVFVMADQILGHMTGRVRIPSESEILQVNRKLPDTNGAVDGPADDAIDDAMDGAMDGAVDDAVDGAVDDAVDDAMDDAVDGAIDGAVDGVGTVQEGEEVEVENLIPPMLLAGYGHRVHMTGLTHDERGYPSTFPDAHKKLMDRLIGKIQKNVDRIVEIQEKLLDDAEIAVVVYGSEARPVWSAVQLARKEGIQVGMMRLITAWPFPRKQIETLSKNVRKIIMPEVNYGQLVHMVREYADCEVISLSHPGGGIHRPDDILHSIREAAR